jgi:uncharacterized protein (DUF983 family)
MDGVFSKLGRALRRRCPRCGGTDIFRSAWELYERCPACNLRFEREPGYWIGAMIINTVVTFGLLLAVLVGGMLVTWPDVPWMGLWVVVILVASLTPILFHPLSRTVWMAIEMSYHPVEPDEL